jgi:dipeptidyl aminopeptidase/acylaminoacyl peptidase
MFKKYLDAFPYSNSYITKDSRYLVYLTKKDRAKRLMLLDLSQSLNRQDAKQISDEDFSKRSYNALTFDSKSSLLYFSSDQENKENFNIYSLDVNTKEITQVTHTTHCNISGFSEDFKWLVFGDRYKSEKGKYFTRLYVRNLHSLEEKLLADDADWEYRFTWSDAIFDEKQENIYLSVDKDNLRKFRNIIKVNLSTGLVERLLPADQECAQVYTLGGKVLGQDLYYNSFLSGIDNFYHLDLNTKAITKLTNFIHSHMGIYTYPDDEKFYCIRSVPEKDESHLTIFKPFGAKTPDLQDYILSGSHEIVEGQALWVRSSNLDMPDTMIEYGTKREFACYIGDKKTLVHNSYQYLEYESFDGKLIPCFISLPKKEVKGAVITSFYGGINRYSWLTQFFAELGLIHLSPKVRGSWSGGKEWQDLIKGDLGGNEILDLHAAASYLEKTYHLKSSQIGLNGGSHGGYSVLRAMTMPENFKGLKNTTYPYAFGICWAGFADLEDFYKTSNIPDWLVNMLGPYEGNEAKYRERSPLHFFENLKAPLFIAHGTNDPRVSPSSMEGFLTKLKNSDKDYVIHLMEGLGHGAGNREEEILLYDKMLSFLKRLIN